MMSDSKKIIDKISFEKLEEEVEKLRKEKDAENIMVCFNYVKDNK